MNSKFQSGVTNIGALVKASFNSENAWSHLVVHLTLLGILFLVNSVKGVAMVEKLAYTFYNSHITQGKTSNLFLLVVL